MKQDHFWHEQSATADFLQQVREATAEYPRFTDGRIDYSHARVCFVLNCVVTCGDQVLLTRRSADVIAYPDTVNGVSGFIDDTTGTLEDIALGELTEELALPPRLIRTLTVSRPFVQIDDEIDREWHVFAVSVELCEQFTPRVNWENRSAQWFSLDDARHMQLMPGFPQTLEVALAMRTRG